MALRSYAALLSILLLGGTTGQSAGCRASASEPFVLQPNIAYTQEPGVDPNLLSLDVYSPLEGGNHPVIVMIHGGGWTNGDKAHASVGIDKGRFFVSQGYVYVSINYRLSPAVMHPVHVQDVANALAFVHDRIAQYGGDPTRVAIMGHSAGAHLAALVSTDARRLEALGKSTDIIKSVILLDGAGYDIPAQMAVAGPLLERRYLDAFGPDVEVQRDASPITHVTPGRTYPPFLILHVAERLASQVQSQALADTLIDAGGVARVVPAEGKTHGTLNRDIGSPGDMPTQEILAFLGEHLS